LTANEENYIENSIVFSIFRKNTFKYNMLVCHIIVFCYFFIVLLILHNDNITSYYFTNFIVIATTMKIILYFLSTSN